MSERTAQGDGETRCPQARQRRSDEETIRGKSGREKWNREGVVGGGIVRKEILSRGGYQSRGDSSGGVTFIQKAFKDRSGWHGLIVSQRMRRVQHTPGIMCQIILEISGGSQ